eukprot:3806873-Amphidinium_carterae.1
MTMRMTQSMLDGSGSFLACYVDDPILCLCQTEKLNRRNVALTVLLWRCLGFPLSFKKGQLGKSVLWTSMKLTIVPGALQVEVKPELLQET